MYKVFLLVHASSNIYWDQSSCDIVFIFFLSDGTSPYYLYRHHIHPTSNITLKSYESSGYITHHTSQQLYHTDLITHYLVEKRGMRRRRRRGEEEIIINIPWIFFFFL